MFSLISPFRRSLLLRVFTISTVISIAIIYALGSNLFGRISDGVINEKIKSSIAEGGSAIQYAEYRFAVASLTPNRNLRSVAEEVVNPTNVSAQESGREIILLSRSGKDIKGIPGSFASNFLKVSSVPQALREEVQNSSETKWAKGTLRYINGEKGPGVFIGKKLNIPRVGEIEMYTAFGFSGQQRTIDFIGRAMLGTGILLILLIMLATSLLLRGVIKPVQQVAEIAEQLTSGDLDKRMDVRGEDELARLGSAFNEMASTLASQIKRLENLSRVQQRFVSDVSHELRTPLTTIRMASDVIHAARKDFDPTISRSAELLLSQIERFENLLADLLEVSRFDAAVASLSIDKVDLLPLTERIIEDLSFLARDRGIEVRLHRPESPANVDGDVRRIERILRNLISNAIDYCEGNPVDVTIAVGESAVAIGVRDYGVGLTEQHISRVFDRFWRADPSRSRIRGGTGLGLSIAKEDTALHGGEIKVWGELGKGANFVVTLPKSYGVALEDFPLSEIPTP